MKLKDIQLGHILIVVFLILLIAIMAINAGLIMDNSCKDVGIINISSTPLDCIRCRDFMLCCQVNPEHRAIDDSDEYGTWTYVTRCIKYSKSG